MTAAEADLRAEVERLRAERDDASEQQAAVAEMLRLITASPGDVQPILRGLVERARLLCHAEDGALGLRDGDFVSAMVVNPRERTGGGRRPLSRDTLWGAAILDAATVQVAGTLDAFERAFPASGQRLRAESGLDEAAILTVPLLQRGTAIGHLQLTRSQAVPFTNQQIRLLETFAAQAVIAIENARLFEETQARLAEQTATAEVLAVISRSPTDLQAVLDAIVERAARLLNGPAASVWLVEADRMQPVSVVEDGHLQPDNRLGSSAISASTRAPGSVSGTILREKRTLTLSGGAEAVVARFPTLASIREYARARGTDMWGSAIAVPLLRNGAVFGMINVSRPSPDPYTERQITLLETFAEQAVIAMENSRLFEALDERNRELTEALEQQTATADILSIISTSPTDLQPVFAAVAERAQRLLGSDTALVVLRDGAGIRFVAHVGPTIHAALNQPLQRSELLPEGGVLAHALRTRQTTHAHGTVDELAHAYPPLARTMRVAGMERRTALAVPLVHAGVALGALLVERTDGVPFADRQIALLETFAAQVVIAMQNTRLFNELQSSNAILREALSQQTATAEVLQIMSSSPTNLPLVLDGIAEAAGRLVGAQLTAITQFDGETLQFMSDVSPDGRGRATGQRLPVSRTTMHGRAYLERRTIAVADFTEHIAEYPDALPTPAQGPNLHSVVATPILHGPTVAGVLAVARGEVRPFSEREIALIEMFASQAAIAITNAQLFEELQQSNAGLREALEQQMATSEILRAISTSPMDPSHALTLIAEGAARFTGTRNIVIFQVAGRTLQVTASTNPLLPQSPDNPMPSLDTNNHLARAVVELRTIHLPDLQDQFDEFPDSRHMLAAQRGMRTVLAVPLLHEGQAIGLLSTVRPEVHPFTPDELTLFERFADQAAIALANAQLIAEIQQKSRELEAANRQLEAATQHKSAFLSAMSHELRTPLNAVIGYSEILQEECEDAGYTDLIPDLEKINGAGKHLLSLISNVLDLSKIEAGRMDVAIEVFAVEKLLGEVEAVVPPLMSKNGNQFVLEAADDLGSMRTDKTKLRQSLLNLLSNAAKFTERGTITLRARRHGDGLTFAVKDTGIGISDEQLGRLFETFTQAEAGTSVRYGGTGLGLALSREFCRLLGGDITVTSTPGTGSTFTITLPAVLAADLNGL